MATEVSAQSLRDELKRRNWLAIAIGTLVMVFSYFPYVSSFTTLPGGDVDINPALVGIGLVFAPFVFVTLGFISRNPKAPKRVLQSMVLLVGLGFTIGLLAPALGATAAFAGGAVLCLNPPRADNVYRWRVGAAVLTVVYVFILLVTATPAGVFSGGLLPLLMVGFADEYSTWVYTRKTADA
jgi:energy-coupling factor transporter transmembrane protein EcfT